MMEIRNFIGVQEEIKVVQELVIHISFMRIFLKLKFQIELILLIYKNINSKIFYKY